MRAGAVVDRELRVIEFDSAFPNLIGVAPADLPGQPIGTFFPELVLPLQQLLVHQQNLPQLALHTNGAQSQRFQLAPLYTSRGTVAGVEVLLEPAAQPAVEADQPSTLHLPSIRTVLDGLFAFAGLLLPDGTLIEANRSALEAAGLAPEDVLQRPFADTYWWAYDPSVQVQLRAAIMRAAQGEVVRYDVVVRLSAERFIPIDFMLAPIKDAQGRVVYLIPSGIDISARLQAQAALVASEARSRATFERAPLGIAHVGLDGRWQQVNPRLCAITGYSPDELASRTFQEITYPDDLATDLALVQRLLAGEIEAYDLEKRYLHKDGSPVWVNLTVSLVRTPTGQPDYFIAMVEEIGHRKAAEAEREALLQRERFAREQADQALALLDTLLTTAPIGLCFLDLDFRYVRINDALAELNGLPAATHLGRTVREVLPNLAPLVEPHFEQVLRTGEPIRDLEIVEERAAVQRLWRASYYPVRLPDGQIAGLGIVATDITGYRAETDALRLSEERFRVALQNSPVIVYTTDHELRYTWVYNLHPAFDTTQVLGRRDEELLPPEEAARLTAVKQRVLDRGVGEREEVQLRIGDQQLVYDLTVEPLRDASGAVVGLTVAAVDYTTRRQTEAALRESEARYSALAEAVPAILFTNQPDGTNDYISQNYYDFTGTRRGSGEGYAWLELLHPDDHERTLAAWQNAVRTGQQYLIEYRFRRHDGVYRWFRVHSRPLYDTQGAIIKWFGVCLDIDDARQAASEREELLARAQAARSAAERATTRIAQLQAVTAALSEALTPPQVAQVIVSQSVAAFGASSSSLHILSSDGASLELLTSAGPPADQISQFEHLALDTPLPLTTVIHTGQALYYENRTALSADYPAGDLPASEACAIVPLSIEGRTIGTLALTFAEPRRFVEEDRDMLLAISRQAAQAIERARLYVAAREAVETRDSFITLASHDLRTPLTVLIGQTQLLERRAQRAGSDIQIIRSVQTIADQSRRLSRMVGALLDLSQIQSGQLIINAAPLNLSALVARVVAEMQDTLSQHVLKCSGETTALWVAGDEVRLEQVLNNLLGNAVKYSPQGGSVQIQMMEQQNQACVVITDEGIGIPAEALNRLFERFYRASNARSRGVSGLGIGLYTVREILNLHGGSVTVSSQEGVGSTFSIYLPLISQVED